MKIPNMLEIAVAWKRAANPTEEQQQIAENRLSICDSCEHKKFVDLVKTYVCDSCGCFLSKKVYTAKGPQGCPEGKWEV